MADDMIAVTIGVDGYEQIARCAAAQVEKHLRLPATVLTQKEMLDVGCDEPHFLKLWLFDLLPAASILYFDADLLFLSDWDASRYAGLPEVVCVRDLFFSSWIQRECLDNHMPPQEYFNAGFFIVNRAHHLQMLKLARRLEPCCTTRLREQTLLNWARHLLEIPARFLSKTYNWVMYTDACCESNLFPVVGAHAPYQVKGESIFRRVLAQEPATTAMFRDLNLPLQEELSGRLFYYHRVGYDVRLMRLLGDNTIGFGSNRCERYWFVINTDDGPALAICSDAAVTCELQPSPDGVWRGNWGDHEKMPIELRESRPPGIALGRGAVLFEVLREAFGETASLRGAEVGVHRGQTAGELLEMFPGLLLYMVDSWKAEPAASAYASTGDPCANASQADQDRCFLQAREATAFAEQRRKILREELGEAAAKIRDGELDFAFLDADHSYFGTLRAMEHWYPKVKRGGLLCGHDYDYPAPHTRLVKQAVHEFAARLGIAVHLEDDYVWYFRKP